MQKKENQSFSLYFFFSKMQFLWDAMFETSKLPKSFHIVSFIGDTLKLIHFERRI